MSGKLSKHKQINRSTARQNIPSFRWIKRSILSDLNPKFNMSEEINRRGWFMM